MDPYRSYRIWTGIAVFNLILLAAAGTLLRYKIAFALPWIDQKSLLHAHSHFAFSGWLSQAFMILMTGAVSRLSGKEQILNFRNVLLAHLVAAYGMLFSFPFGGYYVVSIFFSTLSLVTSAWFAVKIWRAMHPGGYSDNAYLWFKSALFFMMLSAVGPILLTYLMYHHNTDIRLHLIAEYFFLHFQYNGWFLFSGMGILYSFLPETLRNSKMLHVVWLLFVMACVPAYLLSVLWMKLPLVVYIIVVLAAIAQFAGWLILLRKMQGNTGMTGITNFLWILASIAFTIKLFLQLGSTIPELSHFAFGYRPVVIGYLHLMLLGVCSLFVLGAGFQSGYLQENALANYGVKVFVFGVIYNELLLFIQGVTAIIGTYLENIQYWLFSAALVMLTGVIMLFTGAIRRTRVMFN